MNLEDDNKGTFCAVLTLLIILTVVALLFVWLFHMETAEAATITYDQALGGMAYYMDLYVANGGDLYDCLGDTYKVDNTEREVLYRIVEAEVTGEGGEDYLQAKKNVASCIITRWLNGWANSITDVVFQNHNGVYQFSPIKDKRYWSVTVTQQTKDAVDKVLKLGVTHDSTYFCTRTCDSYISGFHSTLLHTFDDCEHAYFKEK